MKHAATQELFSYWNQIRGGRAAPERNDLDPGAIRGILADTFILEVDTYLSFPLRLSGTRLNALFLEEQKGKSFLNFWSKSERHALSAILLTVLDGTCPIVAGVRGGPAGQPEMDLEMLLLPLRHNGKTHARILGILSPAQSPTWLGLLPIENLKLQSMRVVDRPSLTTGPAFARQRPVREDIFAPPQQLAAPAPNFTRHGHLRVYEGGR